MGNADKWDFGDNNKIENSTKKESYNFFEDDSKKYTKSKSSFIGKFQNGLKKEKNVFDKNSDWNFGTEDTKQKKPPITQNKIKDDDKYKKIEEEIVGKKDYKKNMNLELEAQDAEFEKLIECRQCGRSFGRNGYKKHFKVCGKVFKKKKGSGKNSKGGSSKTPAEDKKGKWKKESEAFREMIKANRKGNKDDDGKGGKKKSKTENEYDKFLQDGKQECPLCKQLFSEQGLIRHTPLCQSKQKYNGGGRGGKKYGR